MLHPSDLCLISFVGVFYHEIAIFVVFVQIVGDNFNIIGWLEYKKVMSIAFFKVILDCLEASCPFLVAFHLDKIFFPLLCSSGQLIQH